MTLITNTHKFDLRFDYILFYLCVLPDSKNFMNRAFCHAAASPLSAGVWSLVEKVTVLPLQGHLLGDCSDVLISPFRSLLLRFIPYFYKSLVWFPALKTDLHTSQVKSSPSPLAVMSGLLAEVWRAAWLHAALAATPVTLEDIMGCWKQLIPSPFL